MADKDNPLLDSRSTTQFGNAATQLTDLGCLYGIAKDRHGYKRRGWWQDGVWLSGNAEEALRLLKGGA